MSDRLPILKTLETNATFRLYRGPLNAIFRKEKDWFPNEFGNVFRVVTDLRNNKRKVIQEDSYVFDVGATYED